MTMRLDIVTNDAGELVRREHARELGGGVVVAIYRLAKLAQLHDLGNQAFLRQLEQTHQMIGEYCLRSGSNVSVLFADKATFVAGQLLKGNRGAYLAAAELGDLLQRLGGAELHISRDITREECFQFAEQISLYYRTGNALQLRMPAKIRLRPVADAARLRGIELEELSPDQRIIRAYASAVVIMRRFFEDLAASRYVLPRRIKRIAQSLVDLSDSQASSFLGVTEARNANYDEAGRAVNTAILAVSIARESTHDRATLSQIAMAAMMHDVARPRALALAGAGGSPMPGMAGPTTLSEDQEDRLAAGAAAVLTALGRVNEPSIRRTVLAFEALWLRRKAWLGPVYWGARAPTMPATIIAVARRYNDLLTPEPGLAPPTTDFAVATLANELTDAQERTVLRMLVSALGLLPTGTLVQLATGEVAEVIRGSRGLADKPRVAIVADANGAPYPQPIEVELAQDPRRAVHRVLSVEGWRKGLEQGPEAVGPGPGSESDVQVSAPPAQTSNHGWGDNRGAESPSDSLPSRGSTPSAVGEAMGRVIGDSLASTAAPRDAERPDRTVFEPHGPNDDRPQARPIAAVWSREPTARGNLAATPLPHVLVYMLDHGLTGSVVFEANEPDAQNDTIYFVDGVPAKIRLVDAVALLGEVLVEDGSLDANAVTSALEGAERLGILLGEFLVGENLVSREALSWALEGQLLRKIAHVANLGPEIPYSYYRDVDLLEGWGGDIAVRHPLNPILASVRHWNDRSRVRATLGRIGKHPLALHPDSDLTNLAAIPEEQIVLDAIRDETVLLPRLLSVNLADEEIVSSLVYSLAVTRQFAFKGQKKGPMAARGGAWQSIRPPGASTSEIPSTPSAVPAASGPMAMPPGGGGSSHPSMSTPSMSTARPSPAAGAAISPPIAASAGGTRARHSNESAVREQDGARPHPRPSAQSSSPLIGSSSEQMRAAAPAATSSRRSLNPAVRPRGASVGKAAPQIRPIPGKKPTVVGIQVEAPPEVRPPAPSVRHPESATMSSEVEGPSTPPDDAKTIAIASPAMQDLVAKRAVSSPPAGRSAPEPSSSPEEAGSPGLPAGTKSSSVNPAPKPIAPERRAAAGEPVTTKMLKPNVTGGQLGSSTMKSAFPVPAPPQTDDDLGVVTRPKSPSLDGGENDAGATDQRSAIEIGGDGTADAEAALEAMTSFRLAEGALQRNDRSAAEEHARKAVASDPTQPDYVALLAWIRSLGAATPDVLDEAIRTMSKVLIEDPSNEKALFYRGKLLVQTNRFPEAMNDFNELLSANPHHREAQTAAQALKAKLPT